MVPSKSLTTKEVAQLCCVSDATVKRWESAGLLSSERTLGGHRRFRIEEIARFQKKTGLGLQRSNSDDSIVSSIFRRNDSEVRSECDFFNALICGSEEKACNYLMEKVLGELPLEEILDRSIAPALQHVGQLWFEGKLTIAQEHLATRTVFCALYKLRSILPVKESNGMAAVCCSIEGDFHELPAHFAQMILENEGFEVLNFGANMPVYALCDEISQTSPSIICISSAILSDMDRLARDFQIFNEKLCRNKACVVLGGRAFENIDVQKRFPAEFYAKNFSDLSGFAQNISRSAKSISVN
ncbi:MAG: MerR family DNA-binding transcriptional regulator [Pyrinomonadaceae bacterium]|nr:MerR family DNA-binding transcriptional regulator [Pyrinomonadaceae bacterium]